MVRTKVKKITPELNLFNTVYESIPAFVDVFDEETFYIFAFLVVLSSFLLAFIASRWIKLNPKFDC